MRVEFLRPEWLWTLLLLPGWWLLLRDGRRWGVVFPRTGLVASLRSGGLGARLVAILPRLLRAGAFAALILALAGIRTVTMVQENVREELSIALLLDLSSSMLAEDMGEHRSRLEIAKQRAARFAMAGPRDRIGLVVFGGEALIRVPLTSDPTVVAEAVNSLRLGLVSDGTDISKAITTGTFLLKDDSTRARLAILLTDGAHNTEGPEPARAAATAGSYGIRIYAISVGRPPDLASFGYGPDDGDERVEMETVLARAARITGGRYYRATDASTLDSIYREIDRLEQTSIEVRSRPIEVPREHWLFLGVVSLILLEWAIRGSRFGVMP